MQKIKLGVLGVSGHFIKRVLTPLKKSEWIELFAISSRSKEKAENAAKEHGIPMAYASYQDLIDEDQIQAVYIPLPNDLHAEWIKKSADAGKHIICEKPISLNADEAKEAIAYAAAKKVFITEAFMYKYHPQWQRVSELVQSGEIGNITHIQSTFSYMNQDKNNIRNIKTYGGGALLDIGCYAVSVPRWILRKEPQQVMSCINYDTLFETDILTSGILDFGNTRAGFTVSTQSYPYQKVEIFGKSGIITVNIPFNMFPDVPARVTVITDVGTREIITGPADQYQLMFEHFARVILQQEQLISPPADAINNMKVIDALFKSDQEKNWVCVD